ncbi:hypothetical protein ACVBEG_20860 [Pseudomonas sp. GG8]
MKPLNDPSDNPRCYTEHLLRPTKPTARRQVFMYMDPPPNQLHSTFALDHLMALAERTTGSEFALLMAPIFGLDIPSHTYMKLQNALRERTIQNPEYQVVSEGH